MIPPRFGAINLVRRHVRSGSWSCKNVLMDVGPGRQGASQAPIAASIARKTGSQLGASSASENPS